MYINLSLDYLLHERMSETIPENTVCEPTNERPPSPHNPPPVREYTAWDHLDLKEPLLRGIYGYGFENPSQIQKTAIWPIISGGDVIAQAPSGTGKTGAFTIGTLQRIDLSKRQVQAIVLAPTHELVKQIASVIQSIGTLMEGLVVKTLMGGTSVSNDANELRNNTPHIVVGTVGRVFDMIRRRHIKSQYVDLLIMDEADEMLSKGFKEQIYNIFQYINTNVQVVLFSATMPMEVLKLTKQFMREPTEITMKAEELNLEGIQQFYVALPNDSAKYDTIKDIFSFLTVNQCIIYVNSVGRVVDLYEAMIKDGFSVCCIHSSMRPEEREKSFKEFRTGVYRVMISSNVTSRGIDIQQVSTVINFDIPRCVHTYLHRIGRSGRWGRKGLAINFITRQDVGMMKSIERYYRSNVQELPSDYTSLLR